MVVYVVYERDLDRKHLEKVFKTEQAAKELVDHQNTLNSCDDWDYAELEMVE